MRLDQFNNVKSFEDFKRVYAKKIKEYQELEENLFHYKMAVKILLSNSMDEKDQEEIFQYLFEKYPGKKLAEMLYMKVKEGYRPIDILYLVKDELEQNKEMGESNEIT